MSPRFLPLVAIIVFAPALAEAQVTRQGQGYLFRAKWEPNRTLRYEQLMTITGLPNLARMEPKGPFLLRIGPVRNQVADLVIEAGPIRMGDQTFSPRQVIETRVDSRGRAVGDGPSAQTFSGQFPERPVRIGETWVEDAELPLLGNEVTRVRTTFEFRGVQREGDRNIALLGVTIAGQGAVALNGRGLVRIDAADGMLFKYDVTSQLTLGTGSRATLRTIVVRRP